MGKATEPTTSAPQRDTFDLVLRVVSKLASVPDLAAALRSALRALHELIPFRGGSVQLVSEGVLRVVASDPDASNETLALRLPIGEGISGRVAASGRPLYSPDVEQDPRVEPERRQAALRRNTRSYLAVPLVDAGEVVGVLQINSEEKDAFPGELQAPVLMLGPLIGGIIGQARALAAEEEAARRRDEIEQLRSEFIGLVSHELRTPITVLLGFASLLAGDQGLDVDADFAITRMEAAVERLRRLVGELDRLAALDAGRIEIESQPIHLMPVIEAALAAAAGRPIVVAADEQAPPVFADPRRLLEALRSLIDNAVKFSPPGSVVTVAVRRAGAAVEVTVEDEGPGIPAEQAARVFEPFAQVEALLTRRAGGLGVGLTTARSLVERMGGALDLLPGEHGRFRIRLPIH